MTDLLEKIREDRKFFFGLFAFCVFSLMRVNNYLDQDGYKYLAAIAFFGYCAANVSQRVGLAMAGGKVAVEVQK